MSHWQLPLTETWEWVHTLGKRQSTKSDKNHKKIQPSSDSITSSLKKEYKAARDILKDTHHRISNLASSVSSSARAVHIYLYILTLPVEGP